MALIGGNGGVVRGVQGGHGGQENPVNCPWGNGEANDNSLRFSSGSGECRTRRRFRSRGSCSCCFSCNCWRCSCCCCSYCWRTERKGANGLGEARMLSMSPFESSDVLSVAFSQNFDFYRLNVVAVVGVAVAIAIVKFDAAAALLLLLTICYFLFAICYLLLAMIDDANRSHWGYRVGSRLCPSVCRSAPLPYHHPSPFTPTHTVRRVSMSVCLLCAIMIGIISGMPWKMKTANWQRQHFPSRCFPFAATTSSSASAASTSTAACCNSKLPVATELAAMQ